MTEFASMHGALSHFAGVSGDKVAFRFLENGSAETETFTYAGLERAARRIACWLNREGARGEAVLLAFPAGLEFVAALFGCFFAGAIAVPALLDGSSKAAHRRLIGIAGNVKPRLALTSQKGAALRRGLDEALEGAAPLHWCATEDLTDDTGARPPEAELGIAMIQYTSGSTSSPRGVTVHHERLLANQGMIRSAFNMSSDETVVSWLPHHHDMGLVGSILQTVHAGASAVLMPPSAFLRDPLRWLRAIHTYRGTVSGGPDFGFDYCRRRAAPDAVAALDLTSWRVAFNGSERVKPATLRAFAQVMAPAGFSSTAFVPCYGLAEATLFVAAAKLGGGVVTESQGGGMPVTCCGVPADGCKIAIVDPETRHELTEGQVGEIWVKGPNVADGYWNAPEATQATFAARTSAGEGPYLRTGDLGFVGAAGLFVSGRRKDVMIVCGRNIYAEDVEAAVHSVMPDVPCAAVAVVSNELEKLLVLQETKQKLEPAAADAWVCRLRDAVSSLCGAWVDEVLLLHPGELPRTSSGKVRRSACRERLLSGELRPAQALGSPLPQSVQALLAPLFHADAQERRRAVESWLDDRLASWGVCDAERERTILQLALDSIRTLELGNAIERAFGVHVPWADLAKLSRDELAGSIARCWASDDARSESQRGPAAEEGPVALTPAQSSIWVMTRLWGRTSAYNLALACRVEPELDWARVQMAGSQLWARHPSLRCTFSTNEGVPVQRVRGDLSPSIELLDAQGLSDERLEQTLTALADRPFDLERGPLLRFVLVKRGRASNVLLVVTHHLVADLWSVGLIVSDFARLYAGAAAGETASQRPSRRAGKREPGASAAALEQWWREELRGLPVLRLPSARERSRLRSPLGAGLRLRFGRTVRSRLVAFARAQGVTPCSVVLAAFQHVMSQLSRQSRFAVGCAYAARHDLSSAEATLPHADIVLIRTDLGAGRALAPAAMQAHSALLAVAEHQPMSLQQASALLSERDPRYGPVQAVLVWQQLPSFAPVSLLPVLLGSPDHATHLLGLQLSSFPLPIRHSLFDCVLTLADTGSEIVGDVRQSLDLEPDLAGRVASELSSILESIESGTEVALNAS